MLAAASSPSGSSAPPPFTAKPRCFGLGNPLLDIVAVVDAAFITDRNMKIGGGYLFEEKVHGADLYSKLQQQPGVLSSCGSATLNTIRAVQGLLGEPGATAYTGCVGNDSNGGVLKALCAEDGVRTFLAVSESAPTGVCAVMVAEGDRTMCTNLGACNDYKPANFGDACWAALESCSVVYSAGFHLTVCPEMAVKLADYCAEHKKLYMTGLSADFIPKAFGDKLAAVIANADVVFGNELEFQAYAETKNLKDLEAAAEHIVKLPFRSGDLKRERLAICTQGKDCTLVVSNLRGRTQVPVPPLDAAHIVDSNGAGDAFAAGFIYACLKEGGKLPEDFARACQMGHRIAQHVVRRAGFAFSFTPDDRRYD